MRDHRVTIEVVHALDDVLYQALSAAAGEKLSMPCFRMSASVDQRASESGTDPKCPTRVVTSPEIIYASGKG